MAEDEKKESIWKFYFQTRWQTILTTHFLIVTAYLSFFYIGNIWNAVKFLFYTFITSPEMLGLEFALWGVLFEISVVVPFLTAFYAIFLLPKIWRSHYKQTQKVLLTLLTLVIIPMLIIITDTLARFALATNVLAEFVGFYKIVP